MLFPATSSAVNVAQPSAGAFIPAKANNRDDYDSIAEEIFQLRELKAKSETDSVIRDEKLARITELCDYLKTQPSEITVFDESLVRRMLQKITVFEDHFRVEFKSGVSVDIEG